MNSQPLRDQSTLRNFAIIAHIDHGKTTLTDRLLQKTGTVTSQQPLTRILDTNPIEQERGVTIKLAPVAMNYTLNSAHYKLNLIDTPGHVDFSYEVSRSLAACEGAVLLVDATQGIQAQTLAHAKKAVDLGLTLLPAINKIDLGSAQIEETVNQLQNIFGFKKNEIVKVSAKSGQGVDKLLNNIVTDLPSPEGNQDGVLRALVFNSIFHPHLGVIAFIRVVDGSLDKQKNLKTVIGKNQLEIKEIGIFTPERTSLEVLTSGQVGYLATGLKDIRTLQVGDTITEVSKVKGRMLNVTPLPGFQHPKPVVFADIYPSTDSNLNELKDAVEKLQLTDAALTAKPIHSKALGGGFRLGFLGLFHSEITQERLKREGGVETVITKPTVEYQVTKNNGQQIIVQNANDHPDPSEIQLIKEPMTKATIFTPKEYLGSVMQLVQNRRGIYRDTQYFGNQAQINYTLPLEELISGFVDELKSASKGYTTIDYEHTEPEEIDAVKLKILLNREEIESLSRIVVKSKAQRVGRELVSKLKDVLPRQMFAVPIQAAIGGKIIARETKPAARKDVTAKLYGGDRTRRMKLLQKQKKGKKKLAQFGKVNIPPETFTKIMRV